MTGTAGAARDGLAAFARPSDDARGDAGDDGVIGDVARDDGACGDHRALADADGGDERCVRADRCAVADVCRVPIRGAWKCGAGVADVREHRGRSDEDVLAENDAGPDARVTLDARAGTDDRARRDEAEGADHRVRAERRLGSHDARRVDLGRCARTRTPFRRASLDGFVVQDETT